MMRLYVQGCIGVCNESMGNDVQACATLHRKVHNVAHYVTRGNGVKYYEITCKPAHFAENPARG